MKHTDTNDHPGEYCGIFGVYGIENAAPIIYKGLFALQHRGQEGAGIATSDGRRIESVREMGLVSEVFTPEAMQRLKGSMGIGHTRYSTTGLSKSLNVQPLVVECMDGIWCIAHNGNLTNAGRLRKAYQEAGAIFQTSTDSEVVLHLIADPMYRTRPRRVERVLAEIEGAFSFLLMTKDQVMAARDPLGFRPLCIGRLGKGYVFASETCALEQVGATYVRDVFPGELVTVDDKGIRSTTFCEPVTGNLGQCIFEHVYFSRPDSMIFGENVHNVRLNLGRKLAEEHPVEADIVIPVPDSGTSAALGYSQQSGIPLDQGFIRNHYIGRTFIMPEQDDRTDSIDMKLSVVAGVVKDKRVIVVDDSLVRGNTSRRRIKALRQAGAKEVHMRISCPPSRHPCFFGIDFPTAEELIANQYSTPKIAEHIEADTLAYLSLEGLNASVNHASDYCTGCFSGKYPVDIVPKLRKDALETQSGMAEKIKG